MIKLNSKGASYVGLLASLIVFAAIVLIASNFKVYLSNHEHSVNKHNEISEKIFSHIASVYNEGNWESLENEVVSTDYGDLTVTYEDEGVTEFSTSKLSVTFELDNKQERYSLERSIYYEQ